MMSEIEKMLAGLPHKPNDPALNVERERAKELLHDYNVVTRPSDMAERDRIIRELLGKAGKNVFVTQPFYCDYSIYRGRRPFLYQLQHHIGCRWGENRR